MTIEVYIMSENRVTWISLSKTIALILVIVVHSTPRDYFSGILTGFVLPAFFILYGVTHNNDKHRQEIKSYLYTRLRSLMIPYVLLTIAMVAIYTLCYPFVDFGLTPMDFVYWSFYGNGPPDRVTHLWFLRTMFLAIVLFSLVDRYLHNRHTLFRFFLIGITPAIGVSFKTLLGVDLIPWGVDAGFIALSFMMIGNEIRRRHQMAKWTTSPLPDGLMIPISIVLFLVLTSINGFVNIGASTYGNSVYIYIITGLLGTYFLNVFSYHATKLSEKASSIALKFNKYSQEIYEVHPMIIQINIVFLGGLSIWQYVTIYPGAPLFIVNISTSILLSWIISAKIINRSRYLKFIFCGWGIIESKPTPPQPEESLQPVLDIPIVVPVSIDEKISMSEEALTNA
ncbi:acyltransferase [Candidatus Thorarchaeota archaeon]|nr:MAG: acyltransferase [Candidatus Thorarchaeota archaeon]